MCVCLHKHRRLLEAWREKVDIIPSLGENYYFSNIWPCSIYMHVHTYVCGCVCNTIYFDLESAFTGVCYQLNERIGRCIWEFYDWVSWKSIICRQREQLKVFGIEMMKRTHKHYGTCLQCIPSPPLLWHEGE